jgi:very-short-patch-repair endonuclease
LEAEFEGVAPDRKTAAMWGDNDRNLAAWAARRHGVFSLDEARAFRFTRAEIEGRVANRWEHVHQGVFRVPGAVPTWHSRLLAACLAAEAKPAAVSHFSAAALYELPGGRTDIVEITCRRWKRTVKSGLVVHESTRFDPIDVAEWEGIPVSTPERVVMEVAALRPYVSYVERVIQAARRKRLITYDSTLATFQRLRRRGLPGVKAVKNALELWDPGSRPTHSDMETELLQILRAHGFPEPITQFPVLDEFGNLVATPDLGMPWWKIVIEYDSNREHLDEFQIARDERRRNQMVAAGYKVLIARWPDIRNGGRQLVDEIRRAARQPA